MLTPSSRAFSARRLLSTGISCLALGGVLSFNFLLVLPRTAFAAPGGSVSELTGITIPKHGEPLSDVSSNFITLFAQLGNNSAVKLKPQGEAEVFVWNGDNYEENRTPFIKAAVTTALEAKGYEANDILDRDLHGINIFECFDMSDSSLPFHQNMWKPHFYMQATNEATGKAVLIAFLEDNNARTMGIIPVQFKSKPQYAPPATGTNIVIVKDTADVSKGLGLVHLPKFAPLTRVANKARGWVKDSAGRPLANAEVEAESSVGGGFRTIHHARTNAQGLYEILLPAGVCTVNSAVAPVKYNGTTYSLRMQPVSGHRTQFFAKEGGVENFVLTSGGAMGATVRIQDEVTQGTVEVTLTPMGLMADGSKGHTFVYRYNAAEGYGAFLNGLPLGRYKLTTKLLDADEALPLRIRSTFGSNEERALYPALQIDFAPGYSYANDRSAHINPDIKYVNVTVEP